MLLPSLSILCLAYNEEENVRWAVPELVAMAQKVTDDYELVVVTNAASKDGTNAVLAEFAAANPRIRPIHQPAGSRGYGPAFAFGLSQVHKEFAFHTDIDGQFLFDDIFRAIEIQHATDADLVHFNRHRRKDPLERKIIGLGFKTLVHLFYRCPVWDFDSAFNLFRTKFLRDMTITSTSGLAVPEFIIRMSRMGAKIVSGKTEHQPRRAGKPIWEVKAAGTGIILPDLKIVKANLTDIWQQRRALGSRFII
jgi:glycosyltransferase involved in cell wall biosynthesis